MKNDNDFEKNNYVHLTNLMNIMITFEKFWYWSKAIQHINFTANLDQTGNTKMFFIIEEAKGTILGFSQGTV